MLLGFWVYGIVLKYAFFKKSKKLFENPKAFFEDSKIAYKLFGDRFLIDRCGEAWGTDKPIAIMIGFNAWKREYVSSFLPEYRTAYVKNSIPIDLLSRFIQENEVECFISWSYKDKDSKNIASFVKGGSLNVYRMEDGFLRSPALGASHACPLSMVLDKSGLYFNATAKSDLEDILNEHVFSQRELEYAKSLIDKVIDKGISKYNPYKKSTSVEDVYGYKNKKEF